MKKYNYISLFASVFMMSTVLIATSCIEEDSDAISGKGSGKVRFSASIEKKYGQNYALTAIDATPGKKTIFTINRDAISSSDLNTSVTVGIAIDEAAIDEYNDGLYDELYGEDYESFEAMYDAIYQEVYDENMEGVTEEDAIGWGYASLEEYEQDVIAYAEGIAETEVEAAQNTLFKLLPATAYTWATEGINGSTGTITFGPGEFVKELSINLDATQLDFALQYVIPLKITSASGSYKIGQTAPTLFNQIIVKNSWDGVYNYGGSVGRYAADGSALNDGLDGPTTAGLETSLSTAGANAVIFTMYWANGGGVGGVGNTASPMITINPDNTINLTIVDGGATPANWGPIPGLPNRYDPDTKTFYINWKWAATAPSPSGTTRAINLELTYKKPR